MGSPDTDAVRSFLYSLIEFSRIMSLVDLGCGSGTDLRELGRHVGPDARLVGFDLSSGAVAAACESTAGDGRFAFTVTDISSSLPLEDSSIDLVYSLNVLECIPDKDALVAEIARVLRPGGQVICAHFDLDTQTFDGDDKGTVRKIVHAFNDWKQAWMADCDPWMGRRLWRVFNGSGAFDGAIHTHVLTNTRFESPFYGFNQAQSFAALVRRNQITQQEYDRFIAALQELNDREEYFFSLTYYVYAGRKRPALIHPPIDHIESGAG